MLFKGYLTMSGDTSGCHSGGGALGIHWVKARDAAEHPTTHRKADRVICPKRQERQDGETLLCRVCTVLGTQPCLTLVTPWTAARQAPLSMGFSRQEHWSRLPFPSPGDRPDPGIEPTSPALQADSLALSYLGSPKLCFKMIHI